MTQPRFGSGPMPSEYATLTVEPHGDHILIVTLDRPQVANALNTQMARDLIDLFEGLALDAGGVRCILLTGRGDRAFCAGGDLKERRGMSDAAWNAQHRVFERMVRALVDCPVPKIALVNGAAYGGGCEIAAACDVIHAAAHARFAMTEVTLGIIPGAGGTQTLARAMGQRRALEVILTGTPFDAQEAAEWGLVNRVVPADALRAAGIATAERIAANAPIAVRQARQAIVRGLQMSLADGLAFEIEAYNQTVPTEDRREGVLAFNEGRPAVFKGR